MKYLIFPCLLLFALSIHAQQDNPLTQEQQEQFRQEMAEEIAVMKKIMPRLITLAPRLSSGEKSLPFAFLAEDFTRDEFLDYTGLTNEKAMEIKDKMIEAMKEIREPLQYDIMNDAAKTNDPAEFGKLSDRFFEGIRQSIVAQDEVLREELTPAQLGKFKELRLILGRPNRGVDFMFDFGQYETLNLTDQQQVRIDAILAEYEKEFPPLMEKVFAVEVRRMDRMVETGNFSSSVSEEDKKAEAEALIPLTQLHARVRAQMHATVLTKEQIDQMDNILADAPKYIVQRLGLDDKEAQDVSWRDSWKPGDPIPEQFKRVPRGPSSFPF